MAAMDKRVFGRRIESLLIERKATQTELARQSGVSQAHISAIISGDRTPH